MRRDLDRARIEARLHLAERHSIAEWCRHRGIPLDVWPQHTAALGWIDLAIGRAVEEALRTGRARSRSKALIFACADFGLDGDSVRKRWERTPDKSSLTAPNDRDRLSA